MGKAGCPTLPFPLGSGNRAIFGFRPTEYAYHHTCIAQGEAIDHELLKSTKATTKHLRERREDPINQTCFHCSARKLAEYRSAKDSIDFDPVHFLNNTT